MKPADLPEARNIIRSWIAGETAFLIWRKAARLGQYQWLKSFTQDPDINFDQPSERNLNDIAGRMAAGLVTCLDQAVLFWVSADMCKLTEAASRTVPGFKLEPHDLPAPAGLMVFETPPAQRDGEEGMVGLHAVSWWTPAPGFILMTHFTSHADMEPIVREHAPHRWDAYSSEPELIPLIGQEIGWGFGSEISVSTLTEQSDAKTVASMAAVQTAWLLMQQEITISTAARLDRATRRRLGRRAEPPSVRVITLRRRKAQPGSGDDGHEFHHQWIVRGHWRNQWYPSRGVHRPVWITPHIKGPEGAPMLGGEKVNAWVR